MRSSTSNLFCQVASHLYKYIFTGDKQYFDLDFFDKLKDLEKEETELKLKKEKDRKKKLEEARLARQTKAEEKKAIKKELSLLKKEQQKLKKELAKKEKNERQLEKKNKKKRCYTRKLKAPPEKKQKTSDLAGKFSK